ncbi:YqaE/Pmp3 family membrane protein [Paraglaciecola sp.]|uniref:YqaE/Pmp3 family membrane protein n=1 Tax=Paraglaciecola sp. TaxID=1920173 RepID=UPI003263C3B2
MQKVNPINLILAIFLPPIGAFLQVGLSAHFFINIVLTLLGGIPGVVHALWLVLTQKTG